MKRSNRKALPTKDDAWTALAARWQGHVEKTRRGVQKIRFESDPWVILLDNYTQSSGHGSHTNTRLRSVYRATDAFRFRIYRKSILSGIGRFFGMQDITVGRPDIDPDWIIQSSSEGRIQSLLALGEIAAALKTVGSVTLQVKPLRGRHRAPGRMILELLVDGTLREAERLDAALRLMRSTMERLARLGSAVPPGADIEL